MDFDFCNAIAWMSKLPISELISAMTGALVGGLLSMKATMMAHHLESKRLANEQKTILNNILCLLKEELTTAWEIYKYEYADDLLKLEDTIPYLHAFPIGANSARSCRHWRKRRTRSAITASANNDYSQWCVRANPAFPLPTWPQSNTAKARRISSCFLMRIVNVSQPKTLRLRPQTRCIEASSPFVNHLAVDGVIPPGKSYPAEQTPTAHL